MAKFWRVLSGIVVVIALGIIGLCLYRAGYTAGARDMFSQVNELISTGKMPGQIYGTIDGIFNSVSDFWSSLGKLWG